MIRGGGNKFILILVLFVVIFSTYVRFKIINGSLPYIGHTDEDAITRPALRILKTGNLNPHTFVWPSLPYYLTGASFVLGYENSIAHKELRNPREISSVSYPFYSQWRVVFPAKLFFALLSVMGMVLSGIIARNVFRNKHLIYLAPLLLTLSALYLHHSAGYLNADIIGTFFAVLTVFYITKKLEKDSFLHKSIIPGILCGLSIASKYNFYLVLVPSALAIIFYSKKQIFKKLFLLSFITIIAFIVCVPYSILDFSAFLDDIRFNISHYKTGHEGFEGTPGLSQFFFYCNALIDEYGFGFMAFAILGILLSLILKLKKGMILLSFPLLLLISMSSLRVHFLRNILVIYVFVCVYCSFGIILVFKYLNSQLKKMPYFFNNKILQRVVPALFIGAIISIFLPMEKIINAYNLKPDSRNLSIKWIESNIPHGSIIFVPEELGLDTRGLEKKYGIRYFEGLKLEDDFQEFSSGSYMLIPHYGYDHRDPSGEEISSRLNASFKSINKIVQFGKRPVLVNYPVAAVPEGNPEFYIGKIQ